MYRSFVAMTSKSNQLPCKCSTPQQHASTLHFVTGNPGKLAEVNAIIGQQLEGKMVTVDIDLPEYQGEIDEIAVMKCNTAYAAVQGPVMVEDTSLCFNAMNGLPGPYIKWFLKGCGPEGLFRMLHGFEDKSARAVCAFSIKLNADDGDKPSFKLPPSPYVAHKQGVCVLRGEVDGDIIEPRGKTGFGWDPIFRPRGHEETYAEMESALKNTLSHRFKALALLREFLALNSDQL